MADDLGYGDLSCYGNTILSTPNIDRLAAEGVRCSQHYSGAPLCAPARAALLTGRYHHRCGALSVESNRGLDRIALRERTMGDVFAAAGYRTGYVGKWHSGLHDRRYHPNLGTCVSTFTMRNSRSAASQRRSKVSSLTALDKGQLPASCSGNTASLFGWHTAP